MLKHTSRISISIPHPSNSLVVGVLLEVNLVDDRIYGAPAFVEFVGVPVLGVQTGSPDVLAVGRVLLVAGFDCGRHVAVVDWIKAGLHLAEDRTELL